MITALYTIPVALIFVGLSARVIVYRRSNGIGLGDQGDKSLLKRMRAHGNCAEFAPFGVLLMALVELQNAAPIAVHIIGALLLAGRAAHAYGFSTSPPVMKLRVGGMLLTFLSYMVAIFCLIVLAFTG